MIYILLDYLVSFVKQNLVCFEKQVTEVNFCFRSFFFCIKIFLIEI